MIWILVGAAGIGVFGVVRTEEQEAGCWGGGEKYPCLDDLLRTKYLVPPLRPGSSYKDRQKDTSTTFPSVVIITGENIFVVGASSLASPRHVLSNLISLLPTPLFLVRFRLCFVSFCFFFFLFFSFSRHLHTVLIDQTNHRRQNPPPPCTS